MEAGFLDLVDESRAATVIFLGFPSLRAPLPGQARPAAAVELESVQRAVEAVQKRLRQYDGAFVQFRADEKGFLAIAAMGLPGHSHEDGPARGLQAALAITAAIRVSRRERAGAGAQVADIRSTGRGLTGSLRTPAPPPQRSGGAACAGVTTGQLYCAMVGSARRREEYSVFGNAINTAARLMTHAAREPGAGGVLCDRPTQQLSQGKVRWGLGTPFACGACCACFVAREL